MEKKDALEALSALAQETRIDVYRTLVRAGSAGMAAGAIAAELGVVPNTLSSHLTILAHAGLIESQREGRIIRYTANLDGMKDVLTFLMRDCCQGNPEVCAPVMDILTKAC